MYCHVLCDYKWGFVLVIGLTELWKFVNIDNYSALANLYNQQFAIAHAKSSQSGLLSLVVAG